MAAAPRRASVPLLALALLASHCNVMYGEPPIGQCTGDADCVALGGAGYRCDAQRVCVAAASLAEPAAAADCTMPDSAPAAECAAGGCAAPLSEDCGCLSGAWQDPQALVLGVIAPRTFRSWSGEVLRIPYVPRWEQGLGLALAEWGQELTSGTPRSGRPLALLHCNSNDELFRARRAFTHLTQEAGAPAVITLTDNDTRAIQFQALRQDTAVMCAGCFAAPPAEPNPAVWRVAAPLSDQAPLAAARALEAAAGTRDAAAAPATIVILSQRYAGIDEFVARVEQQLVLAGQAPVRVTAGDPRTEVVAQPQIAQAVISARPSVIVVGMDSDFTTYYLPLIEGGWPGEVPRPHYVLSYLNQELGLLAPLVGGDDELRLRISGTGWHGGAAVAQALDALDERFQARHQQPLDQVQFGYDALYALAYALSWAQQRVPVNGSGVTAGLSRLLAGRPVPVGPASIRSTLALLEAGRDIDLVGSSGGLDWEPLSHTPRSDVGIWCLARAADAALELLPAAGPLWSASDEQITGSYLCP